jgi:transmembrane sensor
MIDIMPATAIHTIVRLLIALQNGSITPTEQQELDAWAAASEANQAFVNKCLNQELVATDLEKLDTVNDVAAWQKFIQNNNINYKPVVPIRRRPIWRMLVAATVAGIIITSGLWWMLNRSSQLTPAPVAVLKDTPTDIAPGSRKATLTLADGSKVNLDDQQDGALAHEGGATVNKQNDELVYSADGTKANETVSYHAVSTPTGGFYSLVLPDKSKVLLNAESSIRYPTAFTGKERQVTVTGEAYFEVAKDAAHPFIVSVDKDLQVKVLGTHFNVNAYTDMDKLRTTLLEGKVEISNGNSKAVLSPGQQASLGRRSIGEDASKFQVQTVDVTEATAWKDGLFSFHSTDFSTVMKEVKRWYDGIESIEIKTPIAGEFTATIPRTMSLVNLLKILEETGNAHFTIEGKKIIVTK